MHDVYDVYTFLFRLYYFIQIEIYCGYLKLLLYVKKILRSLLLNWSVIMVPYNGMKWFMNKKNPNSIIEIYRKGVLVFLYIDQARLAGLS